MLRPTLNKVNLPYIGNRKSHPIDVKVTYSNSENNQIKEIVIKTYALSNESAAILACGAWRRNAGYKEEDIHVDLLSLDIL